MPSCFYFFEYTASNNIQIMNFCLTCINNVWWLRVPRSYYSTLAVSETQREDINFFCTNLLVASSHTLLLHFLNTSYHIEHYNMGDGKIAGLAVGITLGAIFGGILIGHLIQYCCGGAGIFRSFKFVPHEGHNVSSGGAADVWHWLFLRKATPLSQVSVSMLLLCAQTRLRGTRLLADILTMRVICVQVYPVYEIKFLTSPAHSNNALWISRPMFSPSNTSNRNSIDLHCQLTWLWQSLHPFHTNVLNIIL